MALTVLPTVNWSADKLTAFNELIEAAEAYMTYDNALTKLGVNDPTLIQNRTDVGNLIKNVLGPRLKAFG